METNKITHSNYETFMVDYWDGNLEPSQVAMLMCFLDENPEIKKEFLDAGQYTLPDDNLYFDGKTDLLKKEVSSSNIDEFLVAELEHNLLPHEQNELSLFIAANPQYKRDRALYALTKLTPDKNFIYPDKRGLKKVVLQPLWIRYSSVAAAACVLIAIGIWRLSYPIEGELARSAQSNKLPGVNLITNTPITQKDLRELNQTVTAKTVNHNFTGNVKVQEAVTTNQHPKPSISPIQVKDAVSENFYSYGKNRKADDYLSGLVNSYIPGELTIIPYIEEETAANNSTNPDVKPNKSVSANTIANRSLGKIIKDSALANELKNEKYSLKTKVATAIAWATGKASGGKVKAIAIPNLDGSLSALSFTNGRYNYTKRF